MPGRAASPVRAVTNPGRRAYNGYMHGRALALVVLVAALVTVGGGTAADTSATASGRLQSFGTCAKLLGYVRQHAVPLVTDGGVVSQPAGVGAARTAAPEASATAGVDYSATNVQEEGVDEPDVVKTNGVTLFTLRGQVLHALDVRGGRPRLVGSLKLERIGGGELLLRGGRLLVLSQSFSDLPVPLPGGAARSSIMPYGAGKTLLVEVDVGDPGAMKVVRSLELEGSYLSARLVGGTTRVVLTSAMPRPLRYAVPDGPTQKDAEEAAARNRAIVASAPLSAWVPRAVTRDRRWRRTGTRALVQCRNVRRTAAYSGLGMTTVLTIDLDRGLQILDSDAVLTSSQTVYASTGSLYVATQRWDYQTAADEPKDAVTTELHRFDTTGPSRTEYRSSGRVPGYLLNQWALSEHEGVLRVATTSAPAWWAPQPGQEQESRVTTLRERDGALVEVGAVGGLGKGERIYAVRFMGDVGYVVTFRQVDPLYTLDLADPARPRVLGELKILGYSAYLHPLGDDLLLGIGQDATPEGRLLGTQVAVFDVADLRRPARLHQRTIGAGWSAAESDHHAFLYWPATRTVVVPVVTYDPAGGGASPFTGALAFRAGRAGIVELGRIVHPAATGSTGSAGGADGASVGQPISRTLVVADALLTVSDAGVKANALATLAERGWVPFPAGA